MLNQNEHQKEIFESTCEVTSLIEKPERTDLAEPDVSEEYLIELD